MDAYLGEELYDILTYCIQNSDAADFEEKKQRVLQLVKSVILMEELTLWKICFIQLNLE
jgi:hypothetical protein